MNLKKLQKQLEILRKNRESARVKIEYHKKQKDKASNKEDTKAYAEHDLKFRLYTDKLESIRQKIEVVKAQIILKEDEKRKKEYKENLKQFYGECEKHIQAVIFNLKEHSFIKALENTNNLYKFYNAEASKRHIKQEHIKLFNEYIGFGRGKNSPSSAIGNIMDAAKSVASQQASKGVDSGVARAMQDKVNRFTNILIGQFKSLSDQLTAIIEPSKKKKPKGKSITEKIKDKVNGAFQKKKVEDQKGGVVTTKDYRTMADFMFEQRKKEREAFKKKIKEEKEEEQKKVEISQSEEKPKDAALEKALKRFKKARARGEV